MASAASVSAGSVAWEQVEWVRRHMDVVLSGVTTVSTTLFFCGKAFSRVPSQVTRTAFVVQNAVGLAYLDWQVSYLKKALGDCCVGLRAGAPSRAALSAVVVANSVSDLFLTLAGTAAAVASWKGRAPVAQAIYAVTTPWGVAFWFVALFLDLAAYWSHQRLVADLNGVQRECWRASRVFTCLKLLEQGGSVQGQRPEDLQLAARIRASMDGHTLAVLLRASRAPIGAILDNIQTQQSYASQSLGLRAAGYVGLLLCKAYPDSLIQASVMLATSVFYTLSQFYKRWQEAQQQRVIRSHG